MGLKFVLRPGYNYQPTVSSWALHFPAFWTFQVNMRILKWLAMSATASSIWFVTYSLLFSALVQYANDAIWQSWAHHLGIDIDEDTGIGIWEHANISIAQSSLCYVYNFRGTLLGEGTSSEGFDDRVGKINVTSVHMLTRYDGINKDMFNKKLLYH